MASVTSNVGAVVATRSPQVGKAANGKGHYRLPDACKCNYAENFLDDSPFTAEGKLKAVANGVPLAMGRALAKAVMEATTT